VAFVLVGTTHPGNVGAAARALRAMGLRRLILAAPRDPEVCRDPQAIVRASRADDVLAAAQVVPTLEEALAPFTLAVAVSADTREFGPMPEPPEAIAEQLHGELARDEGASVALVFGPERTGLSIEHVGLCQKVCSIPGDVDYSSLNLSQAVQIVAYCLRAVERRVGQTGGSVAQSPGGHPGEPANEAAAGAAATGSGARPATQAQIAGLFEHLERALIDIEFLDPRHPKKLMPRLRRLFGRTRLEAEEVDILRGVCKQIELHSKKNVR